MESWSIWIIPTKKYWRILELDYHTHVLIIFMRYTIPKLSTREDIDEFIAKLQVRAHKAEYEDQDTSRRLLDLVLAVEYVLVTRPNARMAIQIYAAQIAREARDSMKTRMYVNTNQPRNYWKIVGSKDQSDQDHDAMYQEIVGLHPELIIK